MREKLISYLSSIADNYPTGVPKGLLSSLSKAVLSKTAESPVSSSSVKIEDVAKIYFLWVDDGFDDTQQDKFGDEAGTLLKGAIEKGLLLPLSMATVKRCSYEKAADLLSEIDLSQQILILLGEDSAKALGLKIMLGQVTRDLFSTKSSVLLTLPPDICLKDLNAKREFWGHLKIIKGIL